MTGIRKRLIALAVSAVSASVCASGQNTFPASGNVGVGTTAPAQKLEVNGNVQVDGSLFGNIVAGGASDAASIQLGDSAGGMNFFTYWGAGVQNQGYFRFYSSEASAENASPNLTINSNGTVGIGTGWQAPPSTLTVSSPVEGGFAASLTYGSPAAFSIMDSGGELAAAVNSTIPWAYWLQARQQQNTAWSLALNPLGGGVGIGTLSPIGTFNVVPSLTLNPATAGQIILGGNTGALSNANFNQGGNQIIIQGSSYTDAFNGHGANSVLVSGGNIAAAAGIGAAGVAGGNVTISGGSSTGVAGSTAIGGAVVVQGGLAAAGGANLIGSVELQASGGNVGIGTTTPGAKLEVNGNVKLTSGSGGSMTFADNTSQTTAWTGVLCGGDYAESVDVAGGKARYEPGDVMVVDPANAGGFLKSAEPYSTLVAGVYSTNPGVVGRRFNDAARAKDAVPMAMVGIVPTKVSAENGPVKPGDLLVTSSTPGYAMKGTDRERLTGAIVGKALGSVASGVGVVEALVSLQ